MQNPNQTEEVVSMEVLQPSAVEALERAAVDVQVATAHRFPRSLEQFKKRTLSMATLDVETAASCIYRRPIGKKDGQMQYAEGASIRLAEMVAAGYGNLRVAARVIEQTPRYVKVEGVAHDLESNYAAKSEVVEATLKRDGTPYDERMRIVIVKAALAKAFRDAVFKVVPKALCKSVIDAARATAIGDSKTLEERRKKASDWADSLKIDKARVLAALNVKGWSDVGLEHLEILTGLRTAIGDGDVTIDEAFPIVVKQRAKDGPPEQELPQTGGNATGATTDNTNPYEAVSRLAKESNVSELQVLAYLKQVGTAGENLVELQQVSDKTLRNVVGVWKTMLPEIKKAKAE